MSQASALCRLAPIAASHPAARRYTLVRRNVAPRSDLAMAVAGWWAHAQILRLGGTIEVCLWAPGDRDRRFEGAARSHDIAAPDRTLEVAGAVVAAAASSYEISERTLGRLQPGARAPGLLSVVQLPFWDAGAVLTGGNRLILVADGIEYAGNLGALVRTVDASGAGALLLTNPVARLTHPTVFSASRGTVLTTPVLEFPTVDQARRAVEGAGYAVVVADPDAGRDYRDVMFGLEPTALVVGSEGSGVSQEWCRGGSELVAISMRGQADSLNVATAAAVLLFEAVGHDGPCSSSSPELETR